MTTITVEVLQYWIPGRDSSLGDLITNSLGGLIGITCADIWRFIVFPTRRAAMRLTIGWSVLWVAVLVASAELAHISLPDTPVWGVWRPELLHHDYFPGKVLYAKVGGVPLDSISLASADDRRRLSSDSVIVQAAVVGAVATTAVSAIATRYDMHRSEIFMLGQRKGNLIFSLRLRTTDARVGTPVIRLDSVLPPHRPATPDTILVAGGLIHHRLWISATNHGVTRERTQPIDAGLGWSYLFPFAYEYGSEAPWLTLLWIAGLSAPAMYWAVRAGRNAAVLVAASMTTSLLIVPLATSVHATVWWEWIALALGLCTGFALGYETLRASPPA